MPRKPEISDNYQPDRVGRGFSARSEGDSSVTVDQLVSIIKTPGYRANTFFIGWSPADAKGKTKPVVTADEDQLSEDATKIYTVYKEGRGFKLPQTNYGNLTAIEYYINAQLKHSGSGAEDILFIDVVDADGQRQEIRVGETAILEAITGSQNALLDTATAGSNPGKVSSAENLYAPVIHSFDQPRDTAYVMLFRDEGVSQQASFQAFVADTIVRLWEDDEAQKGDGHRGYSEAIEKFLGQENKPQGLAGLLYKDAAGAANGKKLLRDLIWRKGTDKNPVEDDQGMSTRMSTLVSLPLDKLFDLTSTLRNLSKSYFGRS